MFSVWRITTGNTINANANTPTHPENDREKPMRTSHPNRSPPGRRAYLFRRLKGLREGEGSLLDHCLLVYGSSTSDGNRHNHDDLPVAVLGGGGGSILGGRHVRYPQETPLCNLYLSLLDRVGANAERFGDSTGRLRDLEG